MEGYEALLARCPLFQGVTEEELRGLLACLGAKRVSCPRGGFLLRAGEPADRMGIVLSGRALILREDYDGSRSILAQSGPGELFGETFACAGTEYLPVSVQAAEETEALLIQAAPIARPCGRACPRHSRLIYNLMRTLARRNLSFHQKLEITSRRTTREKLLTYLRAQANLAGKATFTIPFDRQALADYLGVDRSGLSTEIGKLRAEGVLKSSKHTFTLLKGS